LDQGGKAKKGDIREHLRAKYQIRENKGVSNHLNQLVNMGLIYKDPDFKNGIDLYFFIIDDFNQFIRIYCENHRDFDGLIHTKYFRTNVHQLVDAFADAIPQLPTIDYSSAWEAATPEEDDLNYLRDTCNLKTAYLEDQLSPEDKKQLETIICENVLAFKFVLNFINSHEDKRWDILGHIIEDVNDPSFNPYSAWVEGYMSGVESVELRHDVPEDVLKTIYSERKKVTEENAQHYWIPFFSILERMNRNYPYLFT
jgi:hypothetical protein